MSRNSAEQKQQADEDNTYVYEEVDTSGGLDLNGAGDEFVYEEVPTFESSDDDELEQINSTVIKEIKKIKNQKEANQKPHTIFPPINQNNLNNQNSTNTTNVTGNNNPINTNDIGISGRPPVVDDFIRNFFSKLKLHKSLDAFQSEWYALKSSGELHEEDISLVPDIYIRNEQLDEQVKTLRNSVAAAEKLAEAARSTWDKFRKERDFHRLHHRRVVGEKNILINDIKRLKLKFQLLQPTMQAIKVKYEQACKDKMIIKLDRDRLKNKVEALEAQLAAWEASEFNNNNHSNGDNKNNYHPASNSEPSDNNNLNENVASLSSAMAPTKSSTSKKISKKNSSNSNSNNFTTDKDNINIDTPLPSSNKVINPHLSHNYEPVPAASFSLRKAFKGHRMAISAVCLHPNKPLLATASDDQTFKIWSLPKGELIMSGEGHRDWLSGVDFSPSGSLLTTSSGDGTVKIWNLATASCLSTLSDHTSCVWDAKFHHSSDFIVSASMDHTARLWDVHTNKCRQTMRGHVDSVNCISFAPYSNIFATASGDKTVSLWDIRTSLCAQTFYGHSNAVISAQFNFQGDSIVSTDADGSIKVWDIRQISERGAFTTNKSGTSSSNNLTSNNDNIVAANDAQFDRSGKVIAAGCDDGKIELFSTLTWKSIGQLTGHEDSVQAVLFDNSGHFLISASSDSTFRLWS